MAGRNGPVFGQGGVLRVLWTGVASAVLVASLATRASAFQHMSEPELVDEFGEDSSEPITAGYFFHEGRYVNAPYVVRRVGLHIYIGDHLVRVAGVWPPVDPYEGADGSGRVPAGLTRDSGFVDLDEAARAYMKYLKKTFDTPEACERLAAFFRRLPLVASAEPTGTGCVVVVDVRGKQMEYVIEEEDEWVPPTRDEIAGHARSGMEFYAGQLRNGVAIFEFPGAELSMRKRMLKRMVEVLGSAEDHDEKVRQLVEVGILSERVGDHVGLVDNYVGSPQLLARLEASPEEERALLSRTPVTSSSPRTTDSSGETSPPDGGTTISGNTTAAIAVAVLTAVAGLVALVARRKRSRDPG